MKSDKKNIHYDSGLPGSRLGEEKKSPILNNNNCSLWFPPFPAPIAQGPWQCQEVMEQPVAPIDSNSDVAPQQALIFSRQKDQQSDSTLSWQVIERTQW